MSITKGTKIWSRFFGPGQVDRLRTDRREPMGHCVFTSVSCWMPLSGLTRLEDAPKEVRHAEKKQAKVKSRSVGGDWISTEEAAARLGLARLEVTILCKKGRIKSSKDGRHWLVSVAGLDLFRG